MGNTSQITTSRRKRARRCATGVLAAAASLTALAVAGCGDDGDSTTASAGEDLSGTTLTMVGYGGGSQSAEERAFADPFAEQTGARIVQETPTDYARIEAMQRAGNVTWDAVVSENFISYGQCGEDKLFQPLKDVDLSQIDPKFITDKCAVPADTYSIALIYNKEAFGDNPPTSWADFFDTEGFPGKRSLWSYVGGNALEVALLGDGVAPDALYPLDVDRAFSKLDTIKDDLTYYDTVAQAVEQVRSGEADMAAGFNVSITDGDAADQVGMVDEQQIVSWDSWVIPNGSPNAAAVESMYNIIATPEAQLEVAQTTPLGPTTKDPDLDAIPEEIRPFIVTGPEIGPTSVFTDPKWYSENFDAINTRYTEFQSG